MTTFTESDSPDLPPREATHPRGDLAGFLGFAVIDCVAGSGQVAVWLISRVAAAETASTNAVVLDLLDDGQAHRKIHAMTRQRVVLQTPGSDCEALPLTDPVAHLSSLDAIVDYADAMLVEIKQAIEAYARRVRSKSLAVPAPHRPSLGAPSDEGLPSARALAGANMLRQAWDYWLRVEQERVRRTVQPKTGTGPWIMPPGLDSPSIRVLPDEWMARAVQQPLEVYGV